MFSRSVKAKVLRVRVVGYRKGCEGGLVTGFYISNITSLGRQQKRACFFFVLDNVDL